ncbi:hypothetical protein BV898_10856 [Hypsibius exemplaris]|uniref:Hexosyltransferase n=1 Tax=Hypsibius exemplaris TaxID=2072580 RepID=A0A1W0WIF1_HYPEX|nr:hypothetical protein BV898_10856 [Hypsibius exemplaris]
MVLFISSRPSDFNRRISIRGTWGRIAGSCSVKVIFGFGKTGEKSGLLERKIAKESRQFGDILQSAAVRDGYRNQTRLVMAFFRYAARECEGTRLVGKADDDIWINFPAILPVLESITSAAYIAGYFFPNGTAVLRDPVHPQSLSRADRETNHYPAYASGAFYALPLRLLGRILSAAENLKVHWIDDAFLTGDVVEAINGNASLWSLPDDRSLIRRIGLNGYTALPDFQTSDGCRLLGSTLIHKVSPEMQRWLHEVPCLSKLHRCRLDGGASSIRTTPTS